MRSHLFNTSPGALFKPRHCTRTTQRSTPVPKWVPKANSAGVVDDAPIGENVSRSVESLSRSTSNENGNGAGAIPGSRNTVFGNGAPAQKALDDLLTTDSGPTFGRPFSVDTPDEGVLNSLPVMLYLPGEDGAGISASKQFPSLAMSFDFEAMTIPASDRTDFEGLVNITKDYIVNTLYPRANGRPLYLFGESFGGTLALAVAKECKDLVDRVVLVNPATSYKESFWPALGPLFAQLPKEVFSLLPIAMAPIFGNPFQVALRNLDLSSPPEALVGKLLETASEMFGTIDFLGDLFDQDLLQWRLTLMQQGVENYDKIFLQVQQRCLVVAGENDLFFPSGEEADRLAKELPRCVKVVLPQRSHALLQEAGVNLVDIMKEQGFYVTERVLSAPLKPGKKKNRINNFGSATGPIEMPTEKEVAQAYEAFAQFRTPASPVHFSTLSDGTIVQGFAGLPKDKRPILFIGNHQTMGIDTFLWIGDMLKKEKMVVRGLAHPMFAQVVAPDHFNEFNLGPFTPGPASDPELLGIVGRLLTTYGAVPVSGKNFYSLLSNNEHVLLYPGGVREAYKMKNEKYKLFWPERAEFVRMAAKFGATIVPLAAVGQEDGIEILLDGNDALNAPIFGDYLKDQLDKYVPLARRGVAAEVGIEGGMIQPITLPGIPQRLYFLMQKPIELSPEDYNDREKCDEIYKHVKSEVESGIDYLIKKREEDPYKDFVARTFYESTQNGKQAPTFKP